eukprot:Nitzschia sp. Nitz4//scaffold230_size58257//19702//21160//NITZ4_006478-RA/size58257-augustus-gene-0.10-mRNA-1//-1//CDS//3329543241//6318//frame0
MTSETPQTPPPAQPRRTATFQPLATMHNNSAHTAQSCSSLLRECEMFQMLSKEKLELLANHMEYKILPKNHVLLKQGQASDRFFLLESGDIRRKNMDPTTGKSHHVEYLIKAKSINSMKVISGDPVYATTQCKSDQCRVFEMQRDVFLDLLRKNPDMTLKISEALCLEIRRGSKKYATPMLEQQQQDVNIPAVSIAAGIESYYRSAMNALLNARLTGVRSELFPNMHIQVPTRISYICGFKILRAQFDERVDAEGWTYPQLVRLGTTLAPGIIMTPISSVLEATNAGHLNPEPMATRWMRGVVPRAGREIIFGVGLNQMSDYFEERAMPYVGDDNMLANAAGSLMAGVVSGYLSHVPHNLSTLKLLHPEQSYGQLYQSFVDKSVPKLLGSFVENWPPVARAVARNCLATLFPRGVMIRTTQIVGSFIILNGTINFLQQREYHKIREAVGTGVV